MAWQLGAARANGENRTERPYARWSIRLHNTGDLQAAPAAFVRLMRLGGVDLWPAMTVPISAARRWFTHLHTTARYEAPIRIICKSAGDDSHRNMRSKPNLTNDIATCYTKPTTAYPIT